jgi:hypothetical protein
MKNEKKQTAVDWLYNELLNSEPNILEWNKLLQQAKEIHKKQMDNVAEDWWNEGASYVHDGKRKYESFQQYYEQTYGKNHIGDVNKMVGGEK